ncbi:hypothetical protein HDV05_004149 [Chytridiales sp. JEL 0842]|nr:hypothetical protein HDV05_004149 [Chytridiales sp. JEL 0842]
MLGHVLRLGLAAFSVLIHKCSIPVGRFRSKTRSWKTFLFALLSILCGMCLMLFFSSIPLQIPDSQWGLKVSNITALSDLYAFDMTLDAENWNIAAVTVRGGDLDIFASADALPSYRVVVFPIKAENAAENNQEILDTPTPPTTSAVNGQTKKTLVAPGHYANNELLGHVKILRTPAFFPPFSKNNSTARVAIVEPSNSIGKIIYMNYPYTLTIQGYLRYTLGAGMFVHAVPICSVHRVESASLIVSKSCLDDGGVGGFPPGSGGGGTTRTWLEWLLDWVRRVRPFEK